ncbi:hypothetical protein C8R43DRAFT_1140039 [Mycena crocata]|nr:hypothetical protein C8R43DRAFT_1140039 [Mycena crocata]
MSTAQHKFEYLQRGERHCNMEYITSEALLSQLIIVYDACYQLKIPTQQTADDDYDDIPDLNPGNAIEVFCDHDWAKKRKQLHIISKL